MDFLQCFLTVAFVEEVYLDMKLRRNEANKYNAFLFSFIPGQKASDVVIQETIKSMCMCIYIPLTFNDHNEEVDVLLC